MCTTLTCLEIVTCAFGCFDLSSSPPDISLTCVGECTARGCADVRFFVDQLVNCAIRHVFSGGDIGGVRTACRDEFAACLMARCP